MSIKHLIVVVLLVINSLSLHAQSNFPSDQHTAFTTIINGYKADSVTLSQLQSNDIHHATYQTPYGYPFGALFIQTHQFVTSQRPHFYIKLQQWLKAKEEKNFIVDGKPLLKKKDLLNVKEGDIEGFSFSHENGRETVEIILAPDFGINYR